MLASASQLVHFSTGLLVHFFVDFSKQVKLLEQSLGAQLFERHQRQVLLTPFGHTFIEHATQVLDQAQRLIEVAEPYRQSLQGDFRLGMIASSCAYLAPYFLGPLRNAFPELKLWIKEGLTQGLIQDLKQGKLDAVIAAQTVNDETLMALPLFFEPFLLVSNAMLKLKKQVAISELEPSMFLLLEDGHCIKDQTLELCAIKAREPVRFQASSMETLIQMTSMGLGYAVIPQLATPQNPRLAKLLRVSQFRDPQIGRTMVLYARKTYGDLDGLRALSQVIQRNLPAELQGKA